MYRRYLGNDLAEWPGPFRDRPQDPAWALWTVTPTSGVVAAYPHFDEHKIRWHDLRDSPLCSSGDRRPQGRQFKLTHCQRSPHLTTRPYQMRWRVVRVDCSRSAT
jgi:hypothetical protein